MSVRAPGKKEHSVKPRLVFTLFVKVLITVLFSLLPLGALFALYAHLVPIADDPRITQLFAGTTTVLHASVANTKLLLVGSVALSLLLAVLIAEILFIAKAKRVLRFVTAMRGEDFKQVPMLPRYGSDELGAIAYQLSFATLEFGKGHELAKDADDQRSAFLMAAAHQLRTPLSELVWAIEELQKGSGNMQDNKQILAAVDGTLKRMRLIIEHLIYGAGLEEGKFGYVFEKIDAIPLVQKIVGEFKPLSEQRQVPLILDAGGSFIVYADVERLSLALFDLISNALNYTKKGSVTVSAQAEGERLLVSVTDTGIGMSEDEQRLLFNKFYRSERARHVHPDGSGLGLYLAKNILEKHGSDLLIESKEGKGTTMSFYLHSDRAKIPR